jgi:hypothetical protein
LDICSPEPSYNQSKWNPKDQLDIEQHRLHFDIERKKMIHNNSNTSNLTPTDGTPMPGSTNQAAVVSNLPSPLQENNNGSTLSATAEDDDDATVQISNSNPTKQGWMSYNIKLLLTNKHNTSDSAL